MILGVAEAERALLGCALSGHPNIEDLAQIVRPVDFSDPRDERVWGAILAVAQTGTRPDPISVQVAMGSEVKSLPGGVVYLVDLMQAAPVVASATFYAEQVRAAATRRHLGNASVRIGQIAADADLDDVDDMLDQAATTIAEIVEARASSDLVMARDVFPEVIDIAEHGRSRGLDTPWPGVDRIIGGIQGGRLYVIGARPGVGKSLMGANLALHFAIHHTRGVLVCSMEMDRVEVMQRITSAHAAVNLSGLMNGGAQMSAAAWNAIAKRHQDILDMAVAIEDNPSQSLTSIRAALRRFKRQRADVALVVVDYLQLMKTSTRTVNRAEALGEISRGLKIIAREFNVAVVAMAQLNREASGSAKPTIAQIRESGSIEADADAVILLHRADYDIPEIDVLIEKNRSGPRGSTSLTIEGHYSRLTDQWRAS